MSKSHKAMPDQVWAQRMTKFAKEGDWPACNGNRPSATNRKWFMVYKKIERCPLHIKSSGLQSIMKYASSEQSGGQKECICGYHNIKNMRTPSSAPSVSLGSATAAPRKVIPLECLPEARPSSSPAFKQRRVTPTDEIQKKASAAVGAVPSQGPQRQVFPLDSIEMARPTSSPACSVPKGASDVQSTQQEVVQTQKEPPTVEPSREKVSVNPQPGPVRRVFAPYGVQQKASSDDDFSINRSSGEKVSLYVEPQPERMAFAPYQALQQKPPQKKMNPMMKIAMKMYRQKQRRFTCTSTTGEDLSHVQTDHDHDHDLMFDLEHPMETSKGTASGPSTSKDTASGPSTSKGSASTSKDTWSCPSTSKETMSGPSTSKGTTSGPSTSKGTTSGPSTSKGTTSGPSTSKETMSGTSTSKGTASGPSTFKNTGSGPSTSKGTTSGPSTSKGTASTSKDTWSCPSTSKETMSGPSTSKGTTSGPSTSKGTSGPSTSKGTTSGPSTSKGTASGPSTSKDTGSGPSTSKGTTSGPSTSKGTASTSKDTWSCPSTSKETMSGPSTSKDTKSGPSTSKDLWSCPSTSKDTGDNLTLSEAELRFILDLDDEVELGHPVEPRPVCTKQDTDPRLLVPSTSKDMGKYQSHSESTSDEQHSVHLADPRESETSCVLLPAGWRKSLQPQDHKWVSKALFVPDMRGRARLVSTLKLWWYPPQTSLVAGSPPSPDLYFARPLLLWMPYSLWNYKFQCPECSKQLTRAGTYDKVRQILDIDGYYNIATERLECTRCSRQHVAWTPTIMSQLDIAHRKLFPAILTYKYGSDLRVIRLHRERTLGNGPLRLMKQLQEQHTEAWIRRSMKYLTDCQGFSSFGLHTFQDPPRPRVVPTFKWLQTVYLQDILSRLDTVKASITSIYGKILKMDSTKKITRKLSGVAGGTAAWLTDIGNEHSQVLMCILTASEGVGIKPMTQGIVRRYRNAKEPPPQAIYVDRDCCVTHSRGSSLEDLFHPWQVPVRLDVWHFMRRFSAGVRTEAHPLYKVFLGQLSRCIFEWDERDINQLRSSKKACMLAEGIRNPTPADVDARITSQELARHCRRQTRGTNTTTRLIDQLLVKLDGAAGQDMLGSPLFDSEKMWEVWKTQKRHVQCIQDPPGVQLYTETGVVKVGGVLLKVLRCARGSTSLESFHLHLNRFIPGDKANDLHFQAYLLEGLYRWNQDRLSSTLPPENIGMRCYDSTLKEAMNNLSMKVLGHKQFNNIQSIGRYTGELIGVEYLYRQTGQSLQSIVLDPETPQEDVGDDTFDDDEGFDETSIDETVGLLVDDFEVQVQFSQTVSKGQQHQSNDVHTPPEDSLDESDHESQQLDQTSDSDYSKESNSGSDSDDEASDAVGPDNVAGYGKVKALAQYLVGVRNNKVACLTKKQTSHIIKLWSQLDEYDKGRTRYQERHRKRVIQGRFKTTRNCPSVGVDSTKRSFIGPGVAAQWPDSSRVVECICIELCQLFHSPTKGKGAKLRWSEILDAYKVIQEAVTSNARVMDETNLALFELNQHTLSQWFLKRQKQKEEKILLQGVDLLPNTAAGTSDCPPTKKRRQVAPVPSHEPHVVDLPADKSGKAKRASTASISTTAPQVMQQPPLQYMPQPPLQYMPQPPLQQMPQPPLQQMQPSQLQYMQPFSMQYMQPSPMQCMQTPVQFMQQSMQSQFMQQPPAQYMQQVPQYQQLPMIPQPCSTGNKKVYRRKNTHNKCKHCGELMTAETGHSQKRAKGFGFNYCPAKEGKEGLTVTQWLDLVNKKIKEGNQPKE